MGQNTRDVKKEFSVDIFLSQYDVKFGISYVIFENEKKEDKILECWSNAKTLCDYKGIIYHNRGHLLVSEETLSNLEKSEFQKSIIGDFSILNGEILKDLTKSQIFYHNEINPLHKPNNINLQ
jgi:hypothetical protein